MTELDVTNINHLVTYYCDRQSLNEPKDYVEAEIMSESMVACGILTAEEREEYLENFEQ